VGIPLCVVVIARAADDDPLCVLGALAAEPGIDACEVLFVDGRTAAAPDEKRPAPVAGLAGLRVISMPGLAMPELKAVGARSARAPSVGFLESKGVPRAGWLAIALRAIADDPGALIGGSVCMQSAPTAANQAGFSFEYGALTPDAISAGGHADLAGNNMILPRAALLNTCAGILQDAGLNKPFCQARLAAAGHPIKMYGDMQVSLQHGYSVRALLYSRFQHARCFGATRVARARGLRKWGLRLGAPLALFVLLMRHYRRMGAAARASARPRPGAWVVLTLLCMSWACAETLGAWCGPGRACARLH